MGQISRALAVLVGVGIVDSGVSLAQDFEQVEIETISVADSVYMLSGEGGNIGVSIGGER